MPLPDGAPVWESPRGPRKLEIHRSRSGDEIAVIGATWHFNDKITFDSLADEFKKNPLLAWRNYGSVIHADMHGAVMDKTVFLRHVNGTRHNPWDLLRDQYSESFVGRRGMKYFMHFDLALNRDKVGIAIVHREGEITVVDFLHQHQPRAGHDVNFADLREKYVYPLRSRNFFLACISFDGFQSAETRQVLAEKGYTTDYCSADRTKEPYDTLIELILGHRLDYYLLEVFIKEMENLQLVDGMKYDHPPRFPDNTPGSKDVADAVACASFMAANTAYEGDHFGKARIVARHSTPPAYERSAW
jgi:hypothetical protein